MSSVKVFVPYGAVGLNCTEEALHFPARFKPHDPRSGEESWHAAVCAGLWESASDSGGRDLLKGMPGSARGFPFREQADFRSGWQSERTHCAGGYSSDG